MIGQRHLKTAQRGARIIEGERDTQTHSLSQLYKIPAELCQEIFDISIPSTFINYYFLRCRI